MKQSTFSTLIFISFLVVFTFLNSTSLTGQTNITGTCDDNGTPFNVSDDYIRFTLPAGPNICTFN